MRQAASTLARHNKRQRCDHRGRLRPNLPPSGCRAGSDTARPNYHSLIAKIYVYVSKVPESQLMMGPQIRKDGSIV